MFKNLTLTSLFWILIGVCLVGYGVYLVISRRMMIFFIMPLALGLVFLGFGSILCGVTNGFTDYSRNGRLLWKFGAIFLGLGLLLTIFGGYRFI